MSEITYAKAFLQQGSSNTSLNVYDHLTALIRKIIVERPNNAVDHLEEFSRKLKLEYHSQEKHFREAYQTPLDLDIAIKWSELLKVEIEEPKPKDEDESDKAPTQPNVMELLYYLEQAGVSLPKHETFGIGISMNKLKEKINAENIRYWGKIFGTEKNYYVAEVTFSEETYENQENEEEEKKEEEKKEEKVRKSSKEIENEELEEEILIAGPTVKPEGIFENAKIPKIPEIPKVKTVVVAKEKAGSGTNSKAYYVCNDPWEEWIRLPDVTPDQIVIARQMRRFFTGILDKKIDTYPPFPGNEGNFLRAQISRISASTQISPLGYYVFDEDEEYEEESDRQLIVQNEEYEPLSMVDLIDPSMNFWNHHRQHILNQGRSNWWNPKEEKEDEDGSEEEEEEEEGSEPEVEKEVGPPLLTPLSEDFSDDISPVWSVYSSSNTIADLAIAVVKSNLWPGAVAYCTARPPQKFENFYIGWGQKNFAMCYSPPPLGPIQFEYKTGPEITEIFDPTPEEEEAVRLEKEKLELEMMEGDEDEEEEEEEEEEDDE